MVNDGQSRLLVPTLGLQSVEQLYRYKAYSFFLALEIFSVKAISNFRLHVNRMDETKCFVLSANRFIKDTEMKWPEVQLSDESKLNFSRNAFERGKENFPICHSGNVIIFAC